MKYSVVKYESGFYTYRQAPDPIPHGGNTIGGSKDFGYWQMNLKIIRIKDSDFEGFKRFFKEPTDGEAEIPYELVEIFKESDGMEYARIRKDLVYDEARGGIYAMSEKCEICDERWEVEYGKEKLALPICATCYKALKEIILKNRQYDSKS